MFHSPSARPALSRAAPLPVLAASLTLLSACGDGGAAGDVDNPSDPFARSPIEDVVGVWNITGHGNRFVNDQAFLIIGPVGEDGTSDARIQEFDDQDLCYLRETGSGEVRTADGTRDERIFMNRAPLFDDAELSLSGGMLEILYFDTDDDDGDGDADERIRFTAPSATRADITPLCTDPFALSPIEPFVGVWELNGPLNGLPEDEAVLVVRPVGEDAESRVLVYELDSRDNCYIRSGTNGRAFPDPAFGDRVFLRSVASFDDGQLSFSGDDLVITYFDTFDVDQDGDTDESSTFTAPSLGISETDLENQLCV